MIATGISSPAERVECLEAGCELGEGALFEERKRTDAPLRRANLGGSSAALDASSLSKTLDSIERSYNNIAFPPKPGTAENQVIR